MIKKTMTLVKLKLHTVLN